MKRLVLGVLGVVLLLVLSFVGMMVWVFAGQKPMTDGQVLPGGARRVLDGYTSAYVLPIGEQEVALVDCGADVEAKTLKTELQRRGLGVDSVKAIFLTHGHSDHLGGCRQFPGAQVFIGVGEEALVAGTAAAKGPIPKLAGATPQLGLTGMKSLHEGEQVEVGALVVKAFVLPGHTAGSAAYLIDGALFVGDSLSFSTEDTVRPAPWVFTDDTAVNVASIKRLGALLIAEQVKVVVPAHSGASQSVQPLIDFSR